MSTDYRSVYEQMKTHGFQLPANTVHIRILNAKDELIAAMKYFLSLEGKQLVWLPQYDEVAAWLEDNDGRGLLLYGTCGLGKTFMTPYAITAVLLNCCGKVVSSYNMVDLQKKADEIMQKHIIALDDIGTEETVSVNYGQKRAVFSEIIDLAEKQGKLLLLTTNLSGEDLITKYQNRTMDRIIALTKRIEFKGTSFRK